MANLRDFEEGYLIEGEDDYEVVCDDDESIGDEDFLASIQSSMQREFDARKAKANREDSTFNHSKNGTRVEDESEAFEEEEVVVVTDEILDHSQGSIGIEEEIVEVQDPVEQSYEYEEQIIEKWFQAESVPDDLEAACRQLIPVVYKGEDHADPESMMRRTPLPELYKYLKQHYDYKKDIKKEICEDVEEIHSDSSKQKTLQALFRKQREPGVADQKVWNPHDGSSKTGVDSSMSFTNLKGTTLVSSIDGEVDDGIGIPDEEMIENWFEAKGEVPKDLETACKKLIQVVYKNRDVDAEKLLTRTPHLELYRQLMQQYIFAKDLQMDKSEPLTRHSNDDQDRSESMGNNPSPGHGRKEPSKKESAPQYQEPLEDSITNFTSSLTKQMGLYEEVFEESLRDQSQGDIVALEEVLGNYKKGGGMTDSFPHHLGDSSCSYIEEEVVMETSASSFPREEIAEEEADNTDDGDIHDDLFTYEEIIVGCERRESF